MSGPGTVRVCVVDAREIVRAGLVALLDGVDGIAVTAAAGTASALPLGAVDVGLVAGERLPDLVRVVRARGGAALVLLERAAPAAVARAAEAGAARVVEQTADRAALVAAVLRAAGAQREAAAPASATSAPAALPDAHLNRTERQVLALYANGAKADAVARSVGLSASTVTTYVSRIRRKYERVGRAACARVDLYHRAVEDGLLPPAAIA